MLQLCSIGYEGMRATASTIFGPSIDNTSDVWGLDGQVRHTGRAFCVGDISVLLTYPIPGGA